ncbi:DUF2782 domain-containing protein [Neptunomonas sp.]|uniref:DUF2782 domain-containing protein n=1 Tax=Neptunomonas sp. TaxID=1971898 RepID=UPI00356AE411
MNKHLLIILTLLMSVTAFAAGLPGDPEEGQPDISIRHQDDTTYYEYRINGELQEIKVVPSVGKPYYLVPSEGHGPMVRIETSTLLIPKWVIFRW